VLKSFIALSLYYFLFFSLIGDYVIFMPKYFKEIGFSSFEIGVIFAMMPIARFITPFLFLKKEFTKKDFLFSIFISTFASFLLLSNNFYLVLLAFFLIGASFSVVFPYIEAIAISKLSTKYGQARLFGSIGFMLFGIVFSYIKVNLVYFFIFLMIITNLTSLYFLHDKSVKKSTKKIDFKKAWRFWVSVVLLQISFGGFYNFFTIYNLNYGIKEEYIGWLWAIGVIFEIGVFIFQHKFIGNRALFWIKISIFLTVIRWFLLYLFAGNLFIVAFSQTIHAFSFAVFHTAALLYLSKIYENKTLAQQFYAGIGYGFAAFLGSIISGWLYGDKLFLYEALIAFLGFLMIRK
jgi:PPP family 3-phenylpropionic acid transporter